MVDSPEFDSSKYDGKTPEELRELCLDLDEKVIYLKGLVKHVTGILRRECGSPNPSILVLRRCIADLQKGDVL